MGNACVELVQKIATALGATVANAPVLLRHAKITNVGVNQGFMIVMVIQKPDVKVLRYAQLVNPQH